MLFEEGAVEAFDEAVRLGPPDLRRPVLDVLELQEELVGVLVRPAAVLTSVVAQDVRIFTPCSSKKGSTWFKDSEWIAQLLECGLVKGSFVPPPPIRDLRDLTRRRKSLIRDRSRQVNRVAKVLELANVKLGSVVSDIMSKTGRAILDAMIEDEQDPQALAGLARGTLRSKRDKLAEAVPGLIRDHHRFLLQRHLRLIDALSRQIEDLDGRIGAVTRPSTRRSCSWRACRA